MEPASTLFSQPVPTLSRFYLVCFLLLYFGKTQSDIVNYFLTMLTGGPVPQCPWGYALVLTTVLTLLSHGLSRACQKHGMNAFIPYIGAAWLAVTLVSIPMQNLVHLAFLLIVAALLVCLQILWTRRRNLTATPNAQNIWQRILPTSVSLLVLSLYMGIGAAATDVDHFEIRTAQALRSAAPKQAYEVGKKSLAVSPRLFAMRCYLMATCGSGIGNEIVVQPTPIGADAFTLLLPTDGKQNLLFSPDSLTSLLGGLQRTDGEGALSYLHRCALHAGMHPSPAADYYLCALLLECRLDQFAQEANLFYRNEIKSHRGLPLFFAQALVLYTHRRTNPILLYHDAAIEANLHDYEEMADKTAPEIRENVLRRSYGETYWWYLDYRK